MLLLMVAYEGLPEIIHHDIFFCGNLGEEELSNVAHSCGEDWIVPQSRTCVSQRDSHLRFGISLFD